MFMKQMDKPRHDEGFPFNNKHFDSNRFFKIQNFKLNIEKLLACSCLIKKNQFYIIIQNYFYCLVLPNPAHPNILKIHLSPLPYYIVPTFHVHVHASQSTTIRDVMKGN